MSIRINYNDKTFEYEVWQHPKIKAYFVDMTEETRIPIRIVKDELEKQFDIPPYQIPGYVFFFFLWRQTPIPPPLKPPPKILRVKDLS